LTIAKELLNVRNVLNKDLRDIEMLFDCKYSGKPLLNIFEFLYSCKPELEMESRFYLNYAIKFYEENDVENIERGMVKLGILCSISGEYKKGEEIFKRVIEELSEKDDYNRVYCLYQYGKLLDLMGRSKEA